MSRSTDRPRRLIEALEPLWALHERIAEAQKFLDEEHMEALGPPESWNPHTPGPLVTFPEALSCSDASSDEWAV
jgi:hypothetical protein